MHLYMHITVHLIQFAMMLVRLVLDVYKYQGVAKLLTLVFHGHICTEDLLIKVKAS